MLQPLAASPNVKWLNSRPTYFPRAKHSSLTVSPLAARTDGGKCTSILGSYSPMTPGRERGIERERERERER